MKDHRFLDPPQRGKNDSFPSVAFLFLSFLPFRKRFSLINIQHESEIGLQMLVVKRKKGLWLGGSGSKAQISKRFVSRLPLRVPPRY